MRSLPHGGHPAWRPRPTEASCLGTKGLGVYHQCPSFLLMGAHPTDVSLSGTVGSRGQGAGPGAGSIFREGSLCKRLWGMEVGRNGEQGYDQESLYVGCDMCPEPEQNFMFAKFPLQGGPRQGTLHKDLQHAEQGARN